MLICRSSPPSERTSTAKRIDFRGRAHVPDVSSDGPALFASVCEQDLAGVVAKRLNEPYRPGERAWIKKKNRAYWRYEIEREGAFKVKRPRQFV